jgi:hypothetical protein
MDANTKHGIGGHQFHLGMFVGFTTIDIPTEFAMEDGIVHRSTPPPDRVRGQH